jgi:hypothetical protein
LTIRRFCGNTPTVRDPTFTPGILLDRGRRASLLPKAPGAELGQLGVDLAMLIVLVAGATSVRLTEQW